MCLEMESLNIGCGSDPWGDVRVDVAFSFITASFKPNVLADAHYLPFKSGAFKVAKASHVMEHLRDPFKALEEMLRVTKSELLLKFPTEGDVLPHLSLIFCIFLGFRRLNMHTLPERKISFMDYKSTGYLEILGK